MDNKLQAQILKILRHIFYTYPTIVTLLDINQGILNKLDNETYLAKKSLD